MNLTGAHIFPLAAASGVALGVIVFAALRSFVQERRALHVLYALTVAVAMTLWVGVALVAMVGGAGSLGPVQYAMQDPGGLAVFRARGSVTGVGYLSVPASLLPLAALFRSQSSGERATGGASVLALWVAVTVVCVPPFMPTV